jgi:hypothetical protein
VTEHLEVAILMIAGFLATAAAQTKEPKTGAPKPAPDTKRLDYFTGNWHTEVEMKAGPWGAGQKWSSDQRCSWMVAASSSCATRAANGRLARWPRV